MVVISGVELVQDSLLWAAQRGSVRAATTDCR
jgi:hypothetical protein